MENNQTMKASELRIENLVTWIFPNRNSLENKIEIHNIEGITKNLVHIRGSFYGYDQIQPIPLTEEWLLRMGFEFKTGWDDFKYYTLDGVELYLTNQGFEYDDQIIKTVHRAQNLFYTLRENELEIKES